MFTGQFPHRASSQPLGCLMNIYAGFPLLRLAHASAGPRRGPSLFLGNHGRTLGWFEWAWKRAWLTAPDWTSGRPLRSPGGGLHARTPVPAVLLPEGAVWTVWGG